MSEPTRLLPDSHPICIVTGASAGIGRETARGMAERGYSVVLIGRDAARTESAADYVRAHARGTTAVAKLCDFSSLAAVRGLAAELLAGLSRIDVLINNAGLWHPRRVLSRDGIEDTLAVNHLAPFLLTNLLLPRLRSLPEARVVVVSSRLHEKRTRLDLDDLQATKKYQGLSVYTQSKLCNVLFSRELAERLRGSSVTSNALHPGDVVSDILRERPLLRFFGRLANAFVDTPTTAARTSIHVATSPELRGVSGAYFKKEKPAQSSPLCEDRAVRERLWQISAELVGIDGGAVQ